MFDKSDGYILLETVIMSICIISLSGCMYFFKSSYINIYDCRARVLAEFMAQQYIDEIVLLKHDSPPKSINCNGIEFYVEVSTTSADDTESKLTKIVISWQDNNITHKLCKEYKYYGE